MLRPPSLSKPYDDFYSGDPAFIKPPPTPAEGEASAEYDEYRAKLKAAKDTGDWSALLLPGQVPTKFVMNQVDRNVWRSIVDRGQLSPENPRHIGTVALLALLFRLAIKDIPGFEIKIERGPDPYWDGWDMAHPKIVDVLDRIDPGIVGELGAGVWRRLRGADPL